MKKKVALPEHYDSIDAPVFVWQRVHESQDFTWLLVKRQKVSKKILVHLERAWERIYDEFIAKFGFPEAFLNIKRKEISIATRKMNLILTGDRTQLTFIEIEQEELDHMRAELGTGDFDQSKVAIEKKNKFQINMRTTSIREFYSYLKDLKKP